MAGSHLTAAIHKPFMHVEVVTHFVNTKWKTARGVTENCRHGKFLFLEKYLSCYQSDAQLSKMI